jgi:DNA-binding Lrp family transcriptional regulator
VVCDDIFVLLSCVSLVGTVTPFTDVFIGYFEGTFVYQHAQAFLYLLSMLLKTERCSLLKFGGMSTLDRVDLELLSALSEDPRTTVVALAERLGLSRNTIQARMARLEQTGVFLSYERSFSPEVLGFPLQAFINIGLRQTELPRITAELARIPEVLQVHGLSGSVDLLARVACRDARHLFDTDARILSIEGVERTETSLAMGEVIPYRVAGLIGLARREP